MEPFLKIKGHKNCPMCKERIAGVYAFWPGFFIIHPTKTATVNKLDGIMVCTSTWITGRTKKELSKSLYTPQEAYFMGTGLIQASLQSAKFSRFWDSEMRKARIDKKERERLVKKVGGPS